MFLRDNWIYGMVNRKCCKGRVSMCVCLSNCENMGCLVRRMWTSLIHMLKILGITKFSVVAVYSVERGYTKQV